MGDYNTLWDVLQLQRVGIVRGDFL